MGWIAGVGHLWERGEGWSQAETKGRSTRWEAPASRSNGKRGMSLQVCGSCFLAGDAVVRHWNGAVQFPELCSLCCPAPALPAACSVIDISSQLPPRSIHRISPKQNPFYLSSPPRGARALQTSLVAGMLAAWEHWSEGCMWEQEEVFTLPLLWCNYEKKIRCGDLELA